MVEEVSSGIRVLHNVMQLSMVVAQHTCGPKYVVSELHILWAYEEVTGNDLMVHSIRFFPAYTRNTAKSLRSNHWHP